MIPPILLGTFQNNDSKALNEVISESVSLGCMGFDTAPSYSTETQLGDILNDLIAENKVNREQLFVSDKIDAWQMINSNGHVDKFIESALSKLRLDYIDMLWIHWPVPDVLENTLETFKRFQDKGQVKQFGICNVRKRHLIELKTKGLLPEFIQIERHPLRTCDEEMDFCKNNAIKVFAYSPLCRMHSDLRNSELLQTVAKKYNKTIGQIILRWHIQTESTPIFMSKKASRVAENLAVFDFSLSKDEIKGVNALNQNYKIFLESWGCPGF